MLKHAPIKNKLMPKLCAEAHGFQTKWKNKAQKVERKSKFLKTRQSFQNQKLKTKCKIKFLTNRNYKARNKAKFFKNKN